MLPLPFLPPKSPDNLYREASPCPFLTTYFLHLSPVLLPSHNLFGSLHSLQSHPPPSPLNSSPLSCAHCQEQNASKATIFSFPAPALPHASFDHAGLPWVPYPSHLCTCCSISHQFGQAYHHIKGRTEVATKKSSPCPSSQHCPLITT